MRPGARATPAEVSSVRESGIRAVTVIPSESEGSGPGVRRSPEDDEEHNLTGLHIAVIVELIVTIAILYAFTLHFR